MILPVWPYAKMQALYPWKALSSISRPKESKTTSCDAKSLRRGSTEQKQ